MRTMKLCGLSAMLAAAVASVMAVQAGGQGMPAESAPSAAPSAAAARVVPAVSSDPVIAKIREEGMQHSEVMATLNYLTNVIGPRLTASVNAKKANEWTRDQMIKWGLANAHLESWAFGGRGWTVKRFTMQVTEPVQISPIAYPKAWSPGLEKPIVADVVLVDARTEEDLQKYHGKLKGAVVLSGGTRAIGPDFSAVARRLTDADLERFATARPGANLDTQATRQGVAATAAAGGRGAGGAATASGPAGAPGGGPGAARGFGGGRGGGGGLAPGRVIAFLIEEGAALQLTVTSGSEMAMTVGQGAVTLPTPSNAAAGAAGRGDGAATASAPAGRGRGAGGRGPNAYSPTAPATLPQVTVSVEHYNRLVRAAQLGVPMKMEVEMKVEFTSNDNLDAFNTIAEIPGSDLKDEVVMLGAHLDSWHMGTGATDNGTGVSECMEAMRIIQAIGAKPRRTIRVGLWTGEEEGLLGSRAYVRQHFGSAGGELLAGRGGRGRGGNRGGDAASAPASQVAASASAPSYLPDHAKFSAYFNTDEGGGRFRGVYAGDNPPSAELLRKWLGPVADLGITVVSPAHATGSDHQSFEGVGLPAFNFLPDPIDYWAGTWHTSQDVYDHVVPEDVKASSVIMATCVYQAAMADEKMPRRQ